MVHSASRVFARLSLATALVTSSLSAGCVTVPTSTPAEADRFATRTIEGRSRAEVFAASSTALQALGFKVLPVDPSSGKLKTAPKLIGATAAGGAHYAIAVETEIAWTLEFETTSAGVVVHAQPRAFAAGQRYEGNWQKAYIEKSVEDLYAEIRANLGARTVAASASTKRTQKPSSLRPAEATPSPVNAKRP